MPRRNGLTDKQIETLPRKAKRTIIADPELRGLYLRIPPAGTNAPITYTAVARDPHGRQIWTASAPRLIRQSTKRALKPGKQCAVLKLDFHQSSRRSLLRIAWPWWRTIGWRASSTRSGIVRAVRRGGLSASISFRILAAGYSQNCGVARSPGCSI